ncbi:MAG: DUF4091 domain-containing protein [Planctomycetes bacterium]|nr:DUF4091 domain-containing protein [Planctomycetota bacterium]
MKRPCPALLALTLLACASALQAAESPLIAGDFESGSFKPFDGKGGAQIVSEHAPQGAKALKLPAGAWQHADPASGLPADWSKFDLVKFEAFNPGTKTVKLNLQLRDAKDQGYWSWHNRYLALLPGANTVQFAVADLWRGEILRNDMGGSLDPRAITALNLLAEGDVVLDALRLERFAAPKVDVPGLRAYKIGPAAAPGFPGFVKLNEKDLYRKESGAGWLKAGFMRLEDRKHPDNLYRSYLSCSDAELAVDLPNGSYRVHLQLEDAGYWEFMQHYTRREVLAEGRTVLDESMDAEEFQRRYFRHQDADDLPGEDPFDKYVEPRFPWRTFDAEVKDGQLNLQFRSPDMYGNTLSAVVLYPAEHSAQGEAFLKYIKELRRFDWAQRWKPVSKPPAAPVFAGQAAQAAARDGFVLYRTSPYAGGDDVKTYDHVPADTELLDRLDAAAAQGESEPAAFALRPAKPLGKLDVTLSPLVNAQGRALPESACSIWTGRYRFTRHQGHQSGLYALCERELRPFNRTPADTLTSDHGLARRFWIHVAVPAEAVPGTYTATLTVKAEHGGTRALPFQLRVLPFALPDPGHLFSLYGIEIMPPAYYPRPPAERLAQREAVYRDLRDHGINYIKDLNVKPAWKDGKASVANAAEIAEELALRKRLGFQSGPVDAPGGASLDELAGGGAIKGLPREQFIAAWHLELTRFFQAQGWPKPFFCYGDEPNLAETLNKLVAVNQAVHAVSPDIWMGIAYHTQSPESYALLDSLDVHHLKDFCKVEDFARAKKAGKFLLNCNVGSHRPAYGLRAWRAMHERHTDGLITYSYTGNHVDPYYDLDAREGDFLLAPPRADGTFVTTARWERIREGIDDFRYARALEALARRAQASSEQRAAAEKLLAQALGIGAVANLDQAHRQAEAWRTQAQEILAQAAKP